MNTNIHQDQPRNTKNAENLSFLASLKAIYFMAVF